MCLRVQRERGIFEPYDVVREGEVIQRLAHSAVPVPQMLGSELDRGPLGAPFIVMEWVDAPHMGVAADANFGAFTETVAAIHGVDWQALGLQLLGVPGSAGAALTAELDAVAARMMSFGCGEEPLLRLALSTLRRRLPEDGRVTLCQGDINIFNYLVRGGRIAAVVDWEQARLSDPRSDVGQLVALSHLKGAPWGEADRQGFVLAYGAAAGRELDGMSWFRARWLFELGVIYHGWVGFNASQPWYSWDEVSGLLVQAIAELD